MKKPASLAEAAAIAQFRFAMIAPVIQGLYPDASRAAYYERVTEKPLTLPDDSTARYSPNTLSSWVSMYQHCNTYQRPSVRDLRRFSGERLPVEASAGGPCFFYHRRRRFAETNRTGEVRCARTPGLL